MGGYATERLLIVEDDADVGAVLEDLLQEEGYRTTLVTSLAAAHQRLGSEEFDLILCDLLLPDGDAELCLRSRAPCLFMAGHPEHIQRLTDEGSHYVAKPFTIAALMRAIRDCLDLGRCSRPAQMAS